MFCIKLVMGRYARYLSIEIILVKYGDENLKPPLRLSAQIMEGRVKKLETYLKSEEILCFFPIFSSIYRLLQALPCFGYNTL